MDAPTCDVRAVVLAVPIIPLPVSPLPSATASPASGVLIWRFGANPGEPQPSKAATNKCLAQSNKSRTGVPATNKRPAARRNSSARRQLGETPLRGQRCRSFTALWRRESSGS